MNELWVKKVELIRVREEFNGAALPTETTDNSARMSHLTHPQFLITANKVRPYSGLLSQTCPVSIVVSRGGPRSGRTHHTMPPHRCYASVNVTGCQQCSTDGVGVTYPIPIPNLYATYIDLYAAVIR